MYYAIRGNAPNRTVTFEYYCSRYLQPSEYYHFQVTFYQNRPGIVQIIYYAISDDGGSSTVGVQSKFDRSLFFFFSIDDRTASRIKYQFFYSILFQSSKFNHTKYNFDIQYQYRNVHDVDDRIGCHEEKKTCSINS